MSGKDAGDENFPVASRFLPAKLRPHILAFYAFARAADDIADAPDLGAEEKLDLLMMMSEQLANGLADPNSLVQKLHHSLQETGVPHTHAQDLLKAFMRDAQTPRTKDWADLMAYCELSAAPVGRYLIDLSDGVTPGSPSGETVANDALCAALQILNHIQDVKDDYQSLDRIYVPADWMEKAQVMDTDLAQDRSTPALRSVLNQMLDGVDDLLVQAEDLPTFIRSRSLAREAGGICTIAKALSKRLRQRDPLAERVDLSKLKTVLCFLWGAVRA